MSETFLVGMRLDAKGVERGAKRASDSIKRVGSTAGGVRKILNRLAGGLAGLFAGFAISNSVRDFADYAQSLKNVATVAGATAQELEKLDNAAKSLALSTRFNPKQITEGLYALASAGQSVNQQLATLPNILDLAEAAQSDLALTTGLVTSTMAQFGIEATDSQRVADVFTASIAGSATNVQRLSAAMRNSGADANAFNQTFEDSVSIISILTSSFENGEKAGTGYKNLLVQLTKNSEKLGINILNASGDMKPLVEILEDITKTGMSTIDLIKILGTEAGSSLAILLETGTKSINEMTESLVSNGQAAETAKEQLNTLKGDFDQLGSATDVLKIKLGEASEVGVRNLIQSLTSLVNVIGNNLPQIITFIKALGVAIAIAFSAKIILSIGSVTNAIVILRTAVSLLIRVMKGSLVGILVTVSAGLYTYFSATKDATRATKELVEAEQESYKIKEQLSKQGLNDAIQRTRLLIDELTASRIKENDEIERANKYSGAGIARQEESEEIRELIAMRQGYKKTLIDLNAVKEVEIKITKESNQLTVKTIENSKKEETQIQKWLKSAKQKEKSLFNQYKLLQLGERAYIAYQAKQTLSIDATEAERAEVLAVTESLQAMVDIKNDALAIQETINDAQNIYNTLLSDTAKSLPEIVQAENKRNETQKALKLLLDKNSISQKAYDKAIQDTTKRFIAEKNAIKGMNDEAKKSKGIFATFFSELKKGFKESIASIKKSFNENPIGATADFATILSGAVDSLRNNDSTARALNEIAATIPIPEIQAISAILSAIDSLFGGRLLGTNYELQGSGFNASTGVGGTSGNQFTDESRQRAFWGGTSRRRTESALSSEITDALDDINDAGIQAAAESARILGVEVAQLVTGSITQNFDADGNMTSSIVDVLGRTYNEGIQQFGERIIAENIFAQVMQLGDVSEVNALANRWRENSELLLEGSKLLLVMQNDLNNGFNILRDGSMTDIVNLVEDMSFANESLAETYGRMVISSKLFDTALDLMGISLNMTRENAVRLATEISESAGGIENATRLWANYFADYFTQNELTVSQLTTLNDTISTQLADIGQDVNFDNFREQFSNALPDLSASEIVLWLRLGENLSRANEMASSLIQTYDGLQIAIEDYLNINQNMIDANMTLGEQLALSTTSINNMINAYDGSIQSETEIAQALTSRYEMEMRFIEQIRQASASISSMIDNSIDNIRRGQQTDEERYDYLTTRSEALAAGLGELTDPQEIQARIAEINRLQSEAYNLLDEGGQGENAQGFIDFLEAVRRESQEQLSNIELNSSAGSDNMIVRLQELLLQSQEREVEIQDNFDTSVISFERATQTMERVAQRLDVIDINVNVNSQSYEDVGNF